LFGGIASGPADRAEKGNDTTRRRGFSIHCSGPRDPRLPVSRPAGAPAMLDFHLATFKVDATPPTGHPLCGGWIKPVVAVDDPLWLRGRRPAGLGPADRPGGARLDGRDGRVAPALDRGPWPTRRTPRPTASRCTASTSTMRRSSTGRGTRFCANAGASPLLYDEAFVAGLGRAVGLRPSASRSPRRSRSPHVPGRPGRGPRGVASNRRIIGPDGKIRFARMRRPRSTPRSAPRPEGTIDPDLEVGRLLSGRPAGWHGFTTTRLTR